MVNRKIDRYLCDFYKNTRKALMLTGARQIGKTFSIRKFGEEHFVSFVEINFIKNPEYAAALSNASGVDELLLRLSTMTRRRLIPHRTLVFFDEVQEQPEIVTKIKFLVEDGRFRYILSGSLLGVYINDIRSAPVGYLDIKDMYPIDFEEFALAVGVKPNVIDALAKNFASKTAVDDFVHSKMMEVFRLYLVVGGMPAAVQKYLNTNDLRQVMAEQRSIVRLYHQDISKYDPAHKLYISEIFDQIPAELNAKNKRFILKNLNENMKFSRYKNSFLWLKDAGVALPTYNVESPALPLILSSSRNLFKLFLSDIGLLAGLYADGIQQKILDNASDINFGSIYENVVAQELYAHGFDLYYYNSKRLGEIDFVIEQNGRSLPIDVKSGKDYDRHRALSNVLKISDFGIENAIVLCNDNVKIDGKITYLPMYMLMFIRRNLSAPVQYKIDLNGLK